MFNLPFFTTTITRRDGSFTARLLSPALGVFIALFSVGCGGGGGGGGGFVGAANVSLQARPTSIDTGDNTRLTVQISEVHEDGIALKVRFPKALTYVPDSAILDADDTEYDVTPEDNVSINNYTYLVFYFDRSTFGNADFGSFTLELKAKTEVEDETIGVDADIDDPLVDNTHEFQSDNPEFAAESEVSIRVRG